MDKEIKDVREIPATGKPNWGGGAYTIAFVYSNKGNFIVKGYLKEIRDYLNVEISKGLKFIVNYTLWSKNPYTGSKHHRDIWNSSNNNVSVFEPDYKVKDKEFRRYKWKIVNYNNDKELEFKRFPKRWIPEFDKIF